MHACLGQQLRSSSPRILCAGKIGHTPTYPRLSSDARNMRCSSAPCPALCCRDRARAPTVLLLNSDDQQGLMHALPALADLPTAGMPLAQSAAELPALGWQLPAAKAAVQQLLAAGEWLQVGGGCAGWAVAWRSVFFCILSGHCSVCSVGPPVLASSSPHPLRLPALYCPTRCCTAGAHPGCAVRPPAPEHHRR